MIATLFASHLLDSSGGLLTAGLVGLFFGWFLEQAGFGSSSRLAGIFYLRDMTVVKVMFTAVVTALIGLQYLTAWGLVAPTELYVLDTYWGAQAAGGVLFGVGFVMGGWCPGTALAGLAMRKWDALVFLVGAVLGSVLFNETFTLIRPLYEGWNAGPLTLAESLHLPMPLLVAAVAVLAVAMFNLCTWLERRAGIPPEVPSWGNIIAEGRTYFQLVPGLVLYTGLFLSVTILSINMLGDALRDALDPKLASRI